MVSRWERCIAVCVLSLAGVVSTAQAAGDGAAHRLPVYRPDQPALMAALPERSSGRYPVPVPLASPMMVIHAVSVRHGNDNAAPFVARPELIRSGSIRADIARYNDERDAHGVNKASAGERRGGWGAGSGKR